MRLFSARYIPPVFSRHDFQHPLPFRRDLYIRFCSASVPSRFHFPFDFRQRQFLGFGFRGVALTRSLHHMGVTHEQSEAVSRENLPVVKRVQVGLGGIACMVRTS